MNLKKNKIVLEIKGISKAFPGVQAVDNVDFTMESGTIHALVGENGAGKSTLMKILSGIIKANSGEIFIDGLKVSINNPSEAKLKGISIIEQEFSLFPELNVYKNIFIGKEYLRKIKTFIDWKTIREKSIKMLMELGVVIDVDKPIKELTTSEQQTVEIAKSIFFGANFIIMDEPTSSLDHEEKERFFTIVRTLKDKGVGIIYITHRMDELYEIAEKVSIMRDGRMVGTFNINDIDENKIIRLMVGRELGDIFYRIKGNPGRNVLEVKGLNKHRSFTDINFTIKEGEVVGLSGLMGAQRTEIVRCIFGLDKPDSGEILLFGENVKVNSPSRAIKLGIGMVPEDRKKDGIISTMTVRDNLVISSLPWINKFGWINNRKEMKITNEQVNNLSIKIVSPNELISKLSGGNQQKVILGRCLALNPKLLILDEPTRGIDVGAKAEIHKIINIIAKNNVAILMISSELPEIIGACDRIFVLHQGKITAEYSSKDVTQEKIIKSALKD